VSAIYRNHCPEIRETRSLKEFLADIRTWDGGVRQFLVDEQCDPTRIERIMADEPKS